MRLLPNSLLFFILAACVPLGMQAGVDSLLEPVKNPLLSQEVKSSTSKGNQVIRNAVRISEPQFLKAIENELSKRFQVEGELKVSTERRIGKLVSNDEHWALEIMDVIPAKLDSRMVLHVRIRTLDKTIGEWKLPVYCEEWRNIYVSAKPIRRGKPISSVDLKVKRVDVLKYHHAMVGVNESILNHEMKSSIPAGEPLYWRAVRETPMVREGQLVQILAKEGTMTITTKGLALQNGVNGDFISVRNNQSRKEIQAQVIDENTVRVSF